MSEPISLTYDEALSLLEKAVEERGADFVTPSEGCVYRDLEGNPSCMVGLALSYIGWTPPEGHDGSRFESITGIFAQPGEWDLDRKARTLLSVVQDYQDAQWSWGRSLEQAKVDLENDA